MPEFKGKLIGLGKHLRKVLQEFGVGLEVWRNLKENRAQLARLAHRLHGLQKTAKGIIGVLEAAEVSDHLVRLGGKAKIRGRAGNPVLQRRRGGKAPK